MFKEISNAIFIPQSFYVIAQRKQILTLLKVGMSLVVIQVTLVATQTLSQILETASRQHKRQSKVQG